MKRHLLNVITISLAVGFACSLSGANPGKIDLRINSSEGGRDKVTAVRVPLDSSVDLSGFDPASRLLAVVIAENRIELRGGSWSQKGECWSYKSDRAQTTKVQFQLDCRQNPNLWSMRASKLTLEQVDSSIGVPIYLEIDGESYGSIYLFKEKGNWRFDTGKNSSEQLEVSGDKMPQFGVEKASVRYDSAKGNSLQVMVNRGSIELDKSFDYQNDSVKIVLDYLTISLPANSFTKHKSKDIYTYNNKDYGVMMKMDLVKGSWSLRAKGFFAEQVNLSDGLDLYLTVGSEQGALRMTGSNQRKLVSELSGDSSIYPTLAFPIDYIGPTVDWQAQDYTDSQGAYNVYYSQSKDVIIVDCDMKGGASTNSKGEVYLDLAYIPTLEGRTPVDFSGKTMTAVLDIPGSFTGPASAPSGCQLFVKDVYGASYYGRWYNCTEAGRKTIRFTPFDASPGSRGIDYTQVSIVGIKFAMNDQSRSSFKGQIKVKAFSISPDLDFSALPDIPADQPVSFLKGNSVISLKEDGFYVGDNKWFVTGGNWCPISYGQNFGSTAWYPRGNGVAKHKGYIAYNLDLFRRAGLTQLRVFLLCDGRSVFDANCNVTGYNQAFRQDVQTFLALCEKYNIKVELVLLDFLVAAPSESVNGVYLQGREKIFTDAATRSAFFRDFLTPFLKEFGNHPAIVSIDCVNESNWLIAQSEGGDWESAGADIKPAQPIALADIKAFVDGCGALIREITPAKFVTLGLSTPSSQLAQNIEFDYYAAHYYPNFGDLGENLALIPSGRPWMLEEYPAKGNLTDYLTAVQTRGGSGALLWNLKPEHDSECYSWEAQTDKLKEIRRFVDTLY